jgi:predicted acyl esterase
LLGDPVRQLDGYTLDDAAQIDIGELRYAWFDYVFKGAPKPAILADRINFEVTGANRWRHVRSLSEMGPGRERFYLSPSARGARHPLSTHVQRGEFLQTLDLADRSDADRTPPAPDVLNAQLDVWNGVAYESVSFSRPTEISGLFAGRLAFVTNKKDFDVNISLFEKTPDGHYLSLTYYEARASYAADREQRRLLDPGRPQALAFHAGRLMSRVFPRGSKLVVVVTLIRSPTEEINYGTGRDVADESIADAKVPLRVRWLGSSFIDIPLAEPREDHADHGLTSNEPRRL